MKRRIAVIGLGYVGLPVCVALREKFPDTIGFDISKSRIAELRAHRDATSEFSAEELKAVNGFYTWEINDLRDADVFIICVPTPVHADHRPDLTPLKSASETVGQVLRQGGIVVYESTVYPGLTEDYCGPILAQVSGLKQGRDFKLGYSPERINPGDKEHTFKKIKKVVSGEDAETAKILAELYGSVVTAGIHVAPSIKTAEMAKVVENTQRDLNIALMNELALICDLAGIRTRDMLEAAGTKWNFLKFTPGLVGGHCIGVDPYYLTTMAEQLGYHPDVILAGRRVNDSMGPSIARRAIQLLSQAPNRSAAPRIGILGITFKENVPDIRNSRVPDIIFELQKFGMSSLIADALANAEEVHHEYTIDLAPQDQLSDLDALILAVPHAEYLADKKKLFSRLRQGGVLLDVKSALNPADVPDHLHYWCL